MKQYWGIDLGGTKIEGVVLDEELRPLLRERRPTEADGGYRRVLENVTGLVEAMAAELGNPPPGRIGMGTSGRIDRRRGLLKNSNTVCLNKTPLLADLEQRLRARVTVENDANCFALAESMLGAGRETMRRDGAVAFGVILGTGVGGGIVCGGKAIRGAHGIAGEWGHNELEPEGEPCYCGRRGCVETVLSGPALERWYTRRSGGNRKSLKEISESTAFDPAAAETVARLIAGFGKAVAGVLNIVDPDILIIGGGVGNVDALYSAEARKALERHLFNDSLDIRVARGLNSATAPGCSALRS
ncbi:ROK family protein [Prosthecochloris sp. GSB1]|uniref:ROK family protein n=1 Tax=Prosthecochloris sp. GSB1 TaxID=281093 RepID=UPI002678B909